MFCCRCIFEGPGEVRTESHSDRAPNTSSCTFVIDRDRPGSKNPVATAPGSDMSLKLELQTLNMNKQIEKAISSLRVSETRYEKYERYYNGDHDLAFATEKFQNAFGTLFREFALNLCPVICDAVRDKLRVNGFSVDSYRVAKLQSSRVRSPSRSSSITSVDSANSANSVNSVDSVNSATRKVWHRNRMGTRGGEIHKEALRCGDAYAIVWPDENGQAVIHPNRAANMTVARDEDHPGRILWAAKTWRAEDKHIRLNLLYPDRIEKYISKKPVESGLPEAKEFVPIGARSTGAQAPPPATPRFLRRDGAEVTSDLSEGDGLSASGGRLQARAPAFPAVIPNPFGIVPVFHFANNADLGSLGRSELEAALPVQDGLNKSVLDMLVAMEFSAYRQRWAAGIEIDYDNQGKAVAPFTAGIDHLWIADNPEARFGDFDAAELEQFLKVKDSFRIDMASVTGTPLHYFLQTAGDFPSGESLKKAETRFLAKVRDRQDNFGQVWSDVMAFALLIEGHRPGISLITEWEDPAPMSDREVLENILLKKQIGLPVEQALLEAGYGAADVGTMVG
ncbi:MAG TPA: phage portal protein [Pyrinomonadaceae bacterium]|nr:phage portal protein [Pyrinomonadaceae bacterium]